MYVQTEVSFSRFRKNCIKAGTKIEHINKGGGALLRGLTFLKRTFVLVSPKSSALGRWDTEVYGMNVWLYFTRACRINTLEILKNVLNRTLLKGRTFLSFILTFLQRGIELFSNSLFYDYNI